MSSKLHTSYAIGGILARQISEDDALIKKIACQQAECKRRLTHELVKQMADASTAEIRIAAAKARARSVYTQIDEITAQSDLTAVQQAPAVPVNLRDVRIDDLPTLFNQRDRFHTWLQERLEKIHAKINWQTRKGQKGYFNNAVHKNNIPIDKALTCLAHLHGIDDGAGHGLDGWVESVIECGLFPKIKKGKFQYSRRCQDGEHCELCNYLNISDGLKTLMAAYDESAFYRGGHNYAITVAARTDAAQAKVVGHTINSDDWRWDNHNSAVYRESHCSRAFQYPDASEADQFGDFAVEEIIRRFLGAVQTTLAKLIKNDWLDGVRGKVENSIQFLPYASHQHWHAVASSTSEHDPQKMAEFIKAEVDAILAQTLTGLSADVLVAVIPTPEDLRRWIKYINKTVKVGDAVASVYNRYPGLRRDDPVFEQFMQEFRLYPQRSRRVFGMMRSSLKRKCGTHTYMLRRHYVRGNHKFGKGSILSEPERHRAWRQRHAQLVADARRRVEKKHKTSGKRHVDGHRRTERQRPRKSHGTARAHPPQAKTMDSVRSDTAGTQLTGKQIALTDESHGLDSDKIILAEIGQAPTSAMEL